METILLIVSILLGLSFALIGLLSFSLYSSIKKNQKTEHDAKVQKETYEKNQQESQKESYEVKQLLHDLTANDRAVVEMRRIDPTQIFVRSPR